jgi:glycosyltransferase involved in cell wall biosynthesis
MDSRVLRQIYALNDEYKIYVAGLGKEFDRTIEFLSLEPVKNSLLNQLFTIFLLLLGKVIPIFYDLTTRIYGTRRIVFQKTLLKYRKELSDIIRETDVVIANDLDSFDIISSLRADNPSPKVIFDMHEYFPLEWEDRILFRLFLRKYLYYRCCKVLPKADFHFTVGEEIAKKYEAEFNIRPEVIMNVSAYTPCEYRPLGKETEIIKLAHYGGVIKHRRLEAMIDMMRFLDEKYHLYFMLVPIDREYHASLKKYAEKVDRERIHFLEPVEPISIAKTLSQFDIGIYNITQNGFNNKFALPNKLFGFIMAGLCVAITPNPAIKRIIEKYKVGVCSSGWSASFLAESIRSLSIDQINDYKRNSLEAAKILNAEEELRKLRNVIITLTEEKKSKSLLRRLNVLHITNMFPMQDQPYSGIFVKKQVDSLAKTGLDVRVKCVGKFFGGYSRIFTLKNDVYWADIIHCHFGHTGSLGLVWKIISSKPIVVSYCGNDLLGDVGRNGKYHFKGKLLAFINSQLSRYVTCAIAKSEVLNTRIKTKKVEVIPSGVDMNLFCETDKEVSKKMINPEGYQGKIILFLGQKNLPVKNFSLFQEALKYLDFEFKYIILENVPYEKVVYFMNASDVCVLTSFHEGSPNVIKEAMACNRPIVSVDVGDVKRLLSGISGCSIVTHNPGEIADSIRKAMQFDKVQARQRLLELGLDLESTAEKIKNIYRDILYSRQTNLKA